MSVNVMKHILPPFWRLNNNKEEEATDSVYGEASGRQHGAIKTKIMSWNFILFTAAANVRPAFLHHTG